MKNINTATQLAEACLNVAKNYKTLYVLGCFGAPMTESNKARWIREQSYNRKPERKTKINTASNDTFGFDCVCLIKALLWDWNGDASKVYGGAQYASNGVPDIGEGQMINSCSDVSTDFSKIQTGEVVWMPGHIGVYVGNGLAVECTPKWSDGVQITAVGNIGTKNGYNTKTWEKHGKLPYVTYETVSYQEPNTEHTKEQLISDVQSSCGVTVDGIGNSEASSNTAIVSTQKNRILTIVKLVRKRLSHLITRWVARL